jgi:hypothetical protein
MARKITLPARPFGWPERPAERTRIPYPFTVRAYVPDPPRAHTPATWLVNAALLLVIAAVLIVLLMYLLRRLDPRRRTRAS